MEWADFASLTTADGLSLNAGALSTLILRNESSVVPYSNKLISTGYNGYIYVHAALIDAYKTEWSYHAAKFRAIEDYPEVWLKNSWEMVNLRIQQGDYASYYAVGDLIPLDMGSEGQINMQIAGFDVDELADGGKAHISFISKELLATSKRFNPTLAASADGTYQEGTGAIGGWEKSELRTYLSGTIMPMIPSEVRSMIKTVVKSQPYYTTAGVEDTQSTDDGVWVPSYDEVVGSSSLYYPLFLNANAYRKKYKVGSSSASNWWLRSAYSRVSFRYVMSSGNYSNDDASYLDGIALGFCV